MAPSLSKGVAYLSIANVSFFLSSYVIYFALARVLPIESFGIYGLVISIATMINIIFVDGMQQAVSKFVSQSTELARAIRRKVFLFALALGLVLFSAFFLFADWIALLFNDAELAPFIQLIGILLVSHPVYAVLTGFFNGLKQFKTQAMLKISYSLLKVAFIIGLALATGSAFGALAGFIAASFSVVALALLLSSGPPSKERFPLKGLIRFALPLCLFAVVANVLLSLDLFAVKALSLQSLSNLQVAYYTAASTISRLPYFAILAFGMVLLPAISSFSGKNNLERIRAHVSRANRYAFMVLMPLVFLISATSERIITWLYPKTYLPGAEALSILVFGLGFFALFYMLSAAVSGYGKPQIPMLIAFAALALDFFANLLLVPALGLRGAAIASLASMLFAFLAISIVVFIIFKAFTSITSFARILIAAVAVSLAIPFMLLPGLLLPLSYVAALALYTGLLFLLRELKPDDIRLFKSVFLRGP